MRIRLGRIAAAACVPMTLLALSACGPGESGADPGPKSSSASSGDEGGGGSKDSAGQGSATEEPTEVSSGYPDEVEPTGPEEPTEVSTDLPKP